MVFYIGEKVEVIDDKTRLLKNKNKSWEYGYNEAIDTVIISKNGTLGEVYCIRGINIGLPQQPDKKEILNHDKTAKNQKWEREEMPSEINDLNWGDAKFSEYIDRQFKWRDEGVWIYLNGQAVYMTGTYWHFLQWFREGSKYPSLRIIQSELMLFWEACKADERCYGMDYVKNRRFGASALGNNEILESGSIHENKILGMISKKGNDAKKIFNRLVRAFKRYPPFFKPETDGTNTPKTELVFTEQTKKRKQGEVVEEGQGLDTIISWHNTEMNAMDGEEIFRSLIDECFARGTKILMSDMSFKNIEDIKVGDEVLVEGGKKVKVAFTTKGIDDLYLIKQPYSKDYVVNSKHRLYLEQRCNVKSIQDDGIKIMTPIDFLNLSKYKKRTTFGLRSKGIELPHKQVSIDPYILGLWLGDGFNDGSLILVNERDDIEVSDYIKKYCIDNDFGLTISDTSSDICKKYLITRPKEDFGKNGKWVRNRFRTWLKECNLLKNKHIPLDYISNDYNTRLELLAGILDSDGHLSYKNGSYIYELGLTHKKLFEDCVFLIRSLGFKVSLREKKTNMNTTAYLVNISGDINKIPCKIQRKIVDKNYTRKYSHYINKIEVSNIGKGEFFGITLKTDNDNDRRLILEDFTISMNCGKYPKEVPFDEYWQIVKTSHRLGSNIVGKSMVVSTVNAMKKGGFEFKKIWDDSNVSERNKNGQTKSGLYRIFIAAKYCLEGFFDEYGFSVVEDPKEPIKNDLGKMISIGASTYLKNEIEALKDDPEKQYEFLRQFPDSERDAFRDESNDCDFNLVHLSEQIEHNEEELDDTEYGNNEVERGNFHWKNGVEDTEVIWKPDPVNGRFWIAKNCHPPLEIRNKKEKKLRNGILAWTPINENIGAGGVDPYNRSKTVDNRGSKGSIHICTGYNTYFPNYAFILEYIDRPKKVEYFFEDVIMCFVYFSMPFLPELSNEKFLQYVKDRGYRNFVLNNPFKLWSELSDTEKEYGGVPPQDSKIGDQQFYAVEAYIQDHIGVARDSSSRPIGEMGFMPFNRTLRQWKDVDTTKRTKYDAYISSSLALLGNQRRVKNKEEEKKPIKIPFMRYDNSGSVSVVKSM